MLHAVKLSYYQPDSSPPFSGKVSLSDSIIFFPRGHSELLKSLSGCVKNRKVYLQYLGYWSNYHALGESMMKGTVWILSLFRTSPRPTRCTSRLQYFGQGAAYEAILGGIDAANHRRSQRARLPETGRRRALTSSTALLTVQGKTAFALAVVCSSLMFKSTYGSTVVRNRGPCRYRSA